MPRSRRTLTVILPLLLAATIILVLPAPRKAQAEIWKWRQTDWSGGPGQAAWGDPTMYGASATLDTKGTPGSVKLSYIDHAFTKDATNPTLAVGGAGSWEESMSAGLYPRPLGTGYEIFYTGVDGTGTPRIGYATSANGINWTKAAQNPVIGTGIWNPNGSILGPVLKENDTYKIWFRGFAAGITPGYGYAESTDAINWTLSPLNPVLRPGTAGSWDESDPTIQVLLHDGALYQAWYTADNPANIPQVGYATSPDGQLWSKNTGNPVLPAGGAGEFDQNGITRCRIVKTPDGYLMAYTGLDAASQSQVGIATSPNGTTWTKSAGNPVVALGAAGTFNELNVAATDLEFDGSIYKMTLMGENGTNLTQVGQAISTDGGVTWNTGITNPILTVGAAGAWDSDYVTAAASQEFGDDLRITYEGAGIALPLQTGTASATHTYAGAGGLLSSVFSPGGTTTWGTVNWTENKPAGTNVGIQVRTGNTPVPDGTWSGWTAVANGGTVPGGPAKFIQYQATLTSGDPTVTPEVSDITIDFQAIPYTWYFAEGYTGTDFNEWLTLENPGADAANVVVTYYTLTGAPVAKPHTVPAHSRYTINVNLDLGQNLENSVRIGSDKPLICERPMYFNYHGIGNYAWTGGHDVMGALQMDRNWYFAEGTTLPNFDEYLLVQNPNDREATVQVTYFVNGGDPIHRRHVVAANSRYTIYVNLDAGQNLELSLQVRSDDVPVICERSLYFDYAGLEGRDWTGGHDILGANHLSTTLYFAEGYTAPNFDQWLTLVNPGTALAQVTLTYYRNGGPTAVRHHEVPGETRYTVFCNSDLGDVDPSEISLKMESTQPILAERPMYFDYAGFVEHSWTGGHDVMGSDGIATDWYFAEGYTGADFDEWLTIENPNAADAHIQITYYTRDAGALPVRNHTVPANSRYTIYVNTDAGANLELSTSVHSTDQPVLCERPMYFDYHGLSGYYWGGGHDVVGFAP